jgi:hypothetical protein
MPDTFISGWQCDADRQAKCSELVAQYDLYANRLFSEYEPTSIFGKEHSRDFFQRLNKWIGNYGSDESRWQAFQFVDTIFYLGSLELTELYRVAFEQIVPEWIAEVKKFNIFSMQDRAKIDSFLANTWFCPITDSLRISAFRHINHIDQPEYFPDWRSLEKFLDKPAKLIEYIRAQKISGLVLLEDFVGSGTQVSPAVQFAASKLNIPVLVLPLIIGLKGDEAMRQIQAKNSNLKYRHVILLDDRCSIENPPRHPESNSAKLARTLCDEFSQKTTDSFPFGFEQDRGYFFVSHSNCPNNSIKPIWSEEGWLPLFPRSGRRRLGK